MADLLLAADRGRLRVLTLNRPDQLNAMNDALYDAVAEALTAAETDPQVATVVLTGAGRAFCVGQDLGEMEQRPTYPPDERHGFAPFIEALEGFAKPLVAAVNGLGVGIGLTLLPYCDRVVIDPAARLRAPFVALGVTAEAGSSVLLPRLIGPANAADILLTGRWIEAAEAVALGLAHELSAPSEALAAALRYAEPFQALPVASLVATKSLLVAGRKDAGREARAREDAWFRILEGGPANREAVAAFRERRPPDFSQF